MSGRDDLDVFFGPIAATTEAANLVVTFDPKLEKIEDTYVPQYLPTLALKNKLKVKSIAVNFIYPPKQKQEEESTHLESMEKKQEDQLNAVVNAHKVILRKEHSKATCNTDYTKAAGIASLFCLAAFFLKRLTN